MTCEDRLIELFRAQGVSYTLHSVDAGALTRRIRDIPPPARVTVAFRSGRPVMLVTGAGRSPNLWSIAHVLGRRDAHFARESDLQALFPDCEPGAMPAVGALYGMPVFLDVDLAREREITFHTGSLAQTVTISMRSFEHLTWPVHASLAMPLSGAA